MIQIYIDQTTPSYQSLDGHWWKYFIFIDPHNAVTLTRSFSMKKLLKTQGGIMSIINILSL